MKLEDDRVVKEREDREAQARAEASAKEAAAIAAREAAESRAREERRLLVEEEARREAMSRAAVEQTRIQVETRARAEEADRERRHEVEIARIRSEAKRQGGAGTVIGSALGGAIVALAACAGVFFGVVRPESARTAAAMEGVIAQAHDDAAALRKTNQDQAQRIAALEEDARSSKLTIDDLERRLEAKRPGGVTPPLHPTGTGPGPTPHPLPKTDGNASDPCKGSKDPLCGLDLSHPR